MNLLKAALAHLDAVRLAMSGAGAGGLLALDKGGSMEKKRGSPWERVKNVQHLWRRRDTTRFRKIWLTRIYNRTT